MTEVDGEQNLNGIPLEREFNNHKAKQGLNCDDNEVARNLPNNEGIHDKQTIEKPKIDEADPLNPNVSISNSVDRGENQINNGTLIPKIEITEGSTLNSSSEELDITGYSDEIKVTNLNKKKERSDSLNTIDDELVTEQHNVILESNNDDKTEGNYNEDDTGHKEGSVKEYQKKRKPVDEISEEKDQEPVSDTHYSTRVTEESVEFTENKETENIKKQDQISKTKQRDIQKEVNQDTAGKENIQNSQNKQSTSHAKHVTFEDNENYDYLILNHQTDEDKELNLDNTTETQNKSFEDDTDQTSQSEASHSWPSYKPESGNQVEENLRPTEEKYPSSHSEPTDTWPTYQSQSQQNNLDQENDKNETQKSNKEPPSDTESWPSYQPDSENKAEGESKSDTHKENLNVENADSSNNKVNNFELQDNCKVEKQVAPTATTDLAADKGEINSESEALDETFPSYEPEPEITPVDICDDTLDDIEPISTITDNPVEVSNVKRTETMENEPTDKSDTTKSEVADDQARADDTSKRDANDDTDLETTEDLKSEEVAENKGSKNFNENDDNVNHTDTMETNAPPTSPDRVPTPDKENTEKEKDETEGKDEQSEKVLESEKQKTAEQNKEVEILPEPVEIPVVRNADVDKTLVTLSDLESTITYLMTDIKNLMGDYHKKLSTQPLSDFVLDLGKFKGDFVSVSEAYKKCESLSVLLNKCLKELRHATDDVNILINKKFREEDLATWIDNEEQMEEDRDKLREERIAVERSALAKASDARAAIANATTGVAESKLLASEAEVEAAETAALAKRAWEIAENARRTATEAKIAAEEKRKAEEEARKRAQERARIKEEEEKKKREEENKVLREEAKKKGATFEDERKRADEEIARKEAERKNPKNWPRQIYSIEPGDFDPGIGCIIRSIDGCLKREDVEVRRLDQMSGILTLIENEELVSNIIEITPTDSEKRFSFEEPLSISIPHCFLRGTQGREAIVKTMQSNGKWIEVPTSDVSFDDIKELKFVEMRTRKFGIFAVVARLKRENLVFSRKGNKVTSSSDPRITLTCRPGMFKINVNFHIEVQTVDSTTLSEVKARKPEECANVITTSPILRFNIANRKFNKPIMITMPLPASSLKPKRPTTAGINREKDDQVSETRSQPARPTTAFVSSTKEDDADEEIHLLVKGHIGGWTKLQNIALIQSKNKDIITFDIPDPYEKFLLLRMKKGMTVPMLEKIPSLLEMSLNHRTIQFFLRQKNTALNNIRLSCTNSGRTEKSLRNLAEEGYEEGPKATKDIIVKEGQVIHVKFRGNLKCLTDTIDLKFVFNTHIKSVLEFNVIEMDKFAQKSFHCYRGFAMIFTMVKVSRQVPPQDTSSSSQQKPVYEVVEEEVLLAELLINLPKPDPEPPQPLATAPIQIKDEGPVTDDILDFVATELGDEWKRLATFLNLKRMRIQAILRQNNSNSDPKRIRMDMLLTWAKRLPRCVNKVEILAHALESIGRADISEVLRDRDEEFRRQRANSSKDSFLRRAFIKVAQNPYAVKDWKAIAKKLGVSEGELIEIDQTKPSIQEKCFHSLKKWQINAGDAATLPTLTAKLKVFKYRQLAREIETIG